MVGDCEREIEIANHAVALNPNSYNAWHCRGYVYRNAGLPEEAIRSFERALRMNPVDPALHVLLSGMGFASLSLDALMRRPLRRKKPNFRTAPIRRLTAVSRRLSPTSAVISRLVRRRHVCSSSILTLLFRCASLAGGGQRRSYLSRVSGKRGCPNEVCSIPVIELNPFLRGYMSQQFIRAAHLGSP